MAAVAMLAMPLAAQTDAENEAAEPGHLVVPLSGTATVRTNTNLSASPSRIDAGLIEIGEFASLTFTLSHDGAAGAPAVSIGESAIIGKNASEFTTAFGGYRSLMPGDSVVVSITFTPSSPGKKSAGLRLDIEGSTSPYVVLFDGASRYPLVSDLAVSPDKVKFGTSILGQPVSKSFVLSNLGENGAPNIFLNDIALSGDTPDAFDVDFSQQALAPNESLTVTVTMNSNSHGTKTATATISHDGNNHSQSVDLEGVFKQPGSVTVSFSDSVLNAGGAKINRGTAIQFGPDGKLYVSEMDGLIKVFEVTRNGKNNYAANQVQVIDNINKVTNHDDDGTPNPYLGKRLLTGFIVIGTSAAPEIYAVSSDPRQAAGPSGNDSNLDTNSGILHKLTKNGGGWAMQDLVRGLPRSEENHVGNGLVKIGNKIIVSMGGHTNQGVPSNNFAELPEYALSGAAVEIDLGQIGNSTYDLPTLDDQDRPGTNDANDPFGGNDGQNQAKLVPGGPVQIYMPGLRNAYDLTVAENGKLYTFDNGPNTGWGGLPDNDCDNKIDNGGGKLLDHLHIVVKGGYGGHPNPTRGNKGNTFNPDNPQSPIEGAAHPIECEYLTPAQDGSLTSINSSTNGIDEYTASNFFGAMKGDLIVASFNEKITRLELNGSGTQVVSKSDLATDLGDVPLDLTTTGDEGPFPGTIWVVDNIEKTIKVLEPSDYQ